MTKKEKTEKCREVLYRNKGKVESIEDIEFLYSIFECHAQWEQKKGCGVDYFYVGKSEYNNACFFIMRTDGSTTDISFGSAIKEPSKINKVAKACRTAIEPEIKAFRETVIYGFQCCPLSGDILTRGNTHIDHYDLSFKELFDRWLNAWEIDNLHDNYVCETKDNECKTYFTDQRIIDDFVSFHNNNTHLRAVTKEANLRRPRK